jgi:hypothetical protein
MYTMSSWSRANQLVTPESRDLVAKIDEAIELANKLWSIASVVNVRERAELERWISRWHSAKNKLTAD